MSELPAFPLTEDEENELIAGALRYKNACMIVTRGVRPTTAEMFEYIMAARARVQLIERLCNKYEKR